MCCISPAFSLRAPLLYLSLPCSAPRDCPVWMTSIGPKPFGFQLFHQWGVWAGERKGPKGGVYSPGSLIKATLTWLSSLIEGHCSSKNEWLYENLSLFESHKLSFTSLHWPTDGSSLCFYTIPYSFPKPWPHLHNEPLCKFTLLELSSFERTIWLLSGSQLIQAVNGDDFHLRERRPQSHGMNHDWCKQFLVVAIFVTNDWSRP